MAANAAVRSGTISLFKRGWNEIPEIMGSSCLALVGVAMGFTGLYIYSSKDGNNRKHKFEYIVIRPDDPRAKLVRTD